MKTSFLCWLAAIILVVTAWGQTPSPVASPGLAASPVPVMTISVTPPAAANISPLPTPTISATPDEDRDLDRDIDSAIDKKIRKHFNFSFDHGKGGSHSDDVPWIAVPIVLIVFLAIFGLPVAIVGVILYFSFSRTRALHKTVRMMVEKGQEVPAALLNPPPVVRQRSDLRRGIVLVMVGLGLMIFFGAVNEWEGGAWSLGIIPFLIGVGYFLVWALDTGKDKSEPSTLPK